MFGKITNSLVAVLFGAGLLGACQTTNGSDETSSTETVSVETESAEADVLSTEDMKKLLVGNTIEGRATHTGSPYKYRECYTPDGAMEGSWKNTHDYASGDYSGPYSIENGVMRSNDENVWTYRLRPVGDGKYELVDSSFGDGDEVTVLEGCQEL